jgi:hypothetical protein
MAELEPYLERLKTVRGIKSVGVSGVSATRPGDRSVKLRTDAGKLALLSVEFKSHLSHVMVDHLIAHARRLGESVLVLAPHIGSGIGSRLAESGINYLDRNGNCHIALGSFYVHIEGQSGRPKAVSEKGLRSPGYQALFAYLANPALLDAPVRTVAEWAGVSRQPPSDVRQRLLEDGYIERTRRGHRWVDRRMDDALNLWLRGYESTVRPSLVWGTYRTRADPDALEKSISSIFASGDVSEFRWGGTAAGFRLTKHYRCARTTVHLPSAPGDLPRQLEAMSDPRGNLVFMDAFGDINWQPQRDTVHPLLVYSEMLREGDERAREAAEEVFETLIRPTWVSPA